MVFTQGCISISVDDDDFHWRVQDWGHIVAQHAFGHGACVIVEPLAIMLPKHVADVIRFGIRYDWMAGQSGGS